MRYKVKPRYKTLSTPKLSATTKPAHPNILQCVRPICRTDMLEKREGEEMEQLNEKYGLECFSDSELDSESDEGENYQYKQKNSRCSSNKIFVKFCCQP